MSEFLKGLRRSHKKATDPKKNLTGHYYPQHQQRETKGPESMGSFMVNLEDLLPRMVDSAAALIPLLEKMVTQNDLLIEASIRHHNAQSIFFDNLNRVFSEEFSVHSSCKKSRPTASYASGTHYTKNDILTIVKTMRKKGATFAIIATALTEKGIPTFSGRGDWHAQTIHRLCK